VIARWFESLTAVPMGIVVVGGFVTVTVLVGYVVARLTPQSVREQHNELAGFILAVIGVIYAVLLAFVVIDVWDRFERAETRTYDEATSLTTVYRDAGSFAGGSSVRAGLREYVGLIVDDEWPRMREGERSPEARAAVEQVDLAVRQLPVKTPRDQDVQDQMLQAMDAALADRDERLSSDATGIGAVMWFVLISGALITVSFTYLFGFKHSLMQHLMTGSLSLLIGLILFLALALEYPYRGGLIVSPEAFENALSVFKLIGS